MRTLQTTRRAPQALVLLAVAALLAALTFATVVPAPAAAAPAKSAKTAKAKKAAAKKLKTRITKKSKSGKKGVKIAFKSTGKKVSHQCRTGTRKQLSSRSRSRKATKKWAACKSPVTYDQAPKTLTVLEVRATDQAGNHGAPASTTVTVPAGGGSGNGSGAKGATDVDTTPSKPSKPSKPTPAEPTTSGPASTTTALRGPGFQPLSDADAAAKVVRSSFEPNAGNTGANGRVPTAGELERYRSARTYELCGQRYDLKVTGQFTGTTDEILQWAAWKWGLDVELLRAVAVVETSWNQALVGDNGESFGLTQVKSTVHEGTYPLAQQSTAFAVDYYGAFLRHYYDGCATWLNDFERGGEYAAGDIYGSMGAWFSGRWRTSAADWYINRVKTELQAKRWVSGRL